MQPHRNEGKVHKSALDMLRGPYLLAPRQERGGDGSRRAPASESGDHGRERADEKRRRSGNESRAAD